MTSTRPYRVISERVVTAMHGTWYLRQAVKNRRSVALPVASMTFYTSAKRQSSVRGPLPHIRMRPDESGSWMIRNNPSGQPSLVLVMAQDPQPPDESPGEAQVRPTLTQEFFNRTNQARIANNREPLAREPRLLSTAEAKAVDMAEFQYFNHVSPRLGGPSQQFQNRWGFVPVGGVGENIVWVSRIDADAPVAMIDALMNSPRHRENMLLDRWERLGVAVVEDTVERILYGVQQFGEPDGSLSSSR